MSSRIFTQSDIPAKAAEYASRPQQKCAIDAKSPEEIMKEADERTKTEKGRS